MNFHSPEAANVAAWREKAEQLEEENKLLRQALTAESSRIPEYRQAFNLTPMEGKILDTLIEAKGTVVSRRRIALRLYGLAAAPRDGEGDQRTVDTLITKLRHKLSQFNSALEIPVCWGTGWSIAPNHRSIILAHVGETTPTPCLQSN